VLVRVEAGPDDEQVGVERVDPRSDDLSTASTYSGSPTPAGNGMSSVVPGARSAPPRSIAPVPGNSPRWWIDA
jgi:hypothetical protein